MNAQQSAAMYTRRSAANGGEDRRGRSQREQEADLREMAARLGLDVVEVYAEREGTGASEHSRKPRPEWERALRDLDTGERFHTLLVWSIDRAERRGAEHIAQLLKRHAGADRRVLGLDGTDTGDQHQRLSLIVRGEMAREEADKLSERVSRARRHARDAGVWQTGPAPFGLQRDAGGRLRHDPATYAIARRIADDALAGLTPYRIATSLNEEGVPAARGTIWRASAVNALLRAPGFAGLASYRAKPAEGKAWKWIGDVYRDADGHTVSVGDGVITEAERLKIIARISGRTTESGRGARGATRPVLLRRILRCSECGAPASVSGGKHGTRSYVCSGRNQGTLCKGFTTPETATDGAVAEAFLRRVSQLDPSDTEDAKLLTAIGERWIAQETPEHGSTRQQLQDELASREAALEALLDLAGILPAEKLRERTQRAQAAIDAAADALYALASPTPDLGVLLDAVQLREAWDVARVDEQRDYLTLAIERVEAVKARARGVRFVASERLTIVWVDGSRTAAGAAQLSA